MSGIALPRLQAKNRTLLNPSCCSWGAFLSMRGWRLPNYAVVASFEPVTPKKVAMEL